MKTCIDPNSVVLIEVDGFCGAGGYTQGVHNAKIDGNPCAVVIIGINHDPVAIRSHKRNHPETIHFIEDFRDVNVMKLLPIVEAARKKYPNAKLVFHMSSECTHHSIAKGGMSRNADSRSLPEHAYRYIDILRPDIISVENVKEFLTWGPLEIKVILDKQGNEFYSQLNKEPRKETPEELAVRKAKGRRKFKRHQYGPTWVPIKSRKGEYYREWCARIKGMGYHYDYKLLNAADYSAFTSRIRYFGLFALESEDIEFPIPTHSKSGTNGTKKWNAVKEVLDFADEGTSIFAKQYCEASLGRIMAGCVKFVAGGKDKFLSRYNSVKPEDTCLSTDSPCGVVTTNNRFAIVKARFLSKAYSGHPDSKNQSVNDPAGTITTVDHHQFVTTYYSPGYNKGIDEPVGTVRCKDCMGLVSPQFLTAYYGNGFSRSVKEPAPTVTVKDRLAVVSPFFMNNYSGGGQSSSVDSPSPTPTTVPKQNLVQPIFMDQQYECSKPASILNPIGSLTANPKFNLINCKWIMNTNYGNVGKSVENPSPSVMASRHHHYLVNPQYDSKGGSVENPCFTLIARMDKMPPSLATVSRDEKDMPAFIRRQGNALVYEIYETDSPKTKEIKEFMALYGITDIKMRMLKIIELLLIMGFPEDYILEGSQTDQKKFIGNAVECHQATANTEALARKILSNQLKLEAV